MSSLESSLKLYFLIHRCKSEAVTLHRKELLHNIHKVVTDIVMKVVGNSVGLWTSAYRPLITSQQEEVILGEDHPE